ncbi:hypothetical protein OsJ_23117 [Oryza sativa Japonica Group]|uniref:Uncharacterized protein n=1 Tax=Oryza sativa subsp. japonica TaxID=39947 RepID=B9FVI9_ORYSJ|nr:hypothetical protein OsJ_23117 [Oryza sativa Japonica Group]
MAAARLASTVLAGRRRAASVVIAAGPRYGGGGGGVHVHPWAAFPSPTATTRHAVVAAGGGVPCLLPRAAFPSPTLPPKPRAFSSSGSLGRRDGVVTISFGVYFFGVFTGRVDVNGFLKGFIIDFLDDPTISVKMHDYVDDLAGSAVESINPIKRFVHWLSGQPRPAHYQKLNEEVLNYYTDWSSILAFAVNSIAKSEGGKISEKALWRFLINVGVQETKLNKALLKVLVRERFILRQEYKGVISYKMVENEYKTNFKGKIQERIRPILKSEFVMPAAARGPKSKPSH